LNENCGNCGACMKISAAMGYCRDFGIYISLRHEGCNYYHREERRANGTTGKSEPEAGVATGRRM